MRIRRSLRESLGGTCAMLCVLATVLCCVAATRQALAGGSATRSRDGVCWFESYETMPDGTLTLLGGPVWAATFDIGSMTELRVPGVVNGMDANPYAAHLVTGFGRRSAAANGYVNGYDMVPSLRKIYIPRCITFIGYEAFSGCGTVTDVYYGGTSRQWSDAVGGRDIGLRSGARVHFQSAEANDLGTCAYYPDSLQTTYYPEVNGWWYFKILDEEFRASEIVPRHALMFGGERLVEGRDYSLACEDNRSCGTARLTAVGAGEYSGASPSEFEIVRVSDEHLEANLSVAGASKVVETYTDDRGVTHESVRWQLPDRATPDAPEISLLYSGKELRKGEDYTIEMPYFFSEDYGYRVGYRARFSFAYGDEFIWVRYGVKDHTSVAAFSDVSGSIAHHDDIAWAASLGISKGWDMPDGTVQFRPYANVARADMAAFLFRLAKSWGIVDDSWQPKGGSAFADVTAATPHYREVMWLAESGISKGWDVGGGRKEFRPYADVARADMAAFLHRLAQRAAINGSSGGGVSFRDVTTKTAHAEDIAWLAATGVSKGWDVEGGKKEFRPLANVARADMAAFLHRLDGLRYQGGQGM